MKKNKVYSVVCGGAVAANGGAQTMNFILESTCSEIKLKSIYWDVELMEAVTGIPLNEFQQQSQRLVLEIGLNVWPISSIFQPGVGPPVIVQNGDTICIHKQGQILFDSFYIQNRTNVRFFGVNFDVILLISQIATIIIETEETL